MKSLVAREGSYWQVLGVKELTEGENENEVECNVYGPLHYGSF